MVTKVDMDVPELAEVGAQIAEIGVKLKSLRVKRDELNTEISELEQELHPLVVKHSKLIAEIVGTSAQTPAPAAAAPVVPGAPAPPTEGPPSEAMKKRVLQFLKRTHDQVSAQEVAEALSIPAQVVRDVMRDMMRTPPSSA